MPKPVQACRLASVREDVALAAGTLIAKVWPRPDRGPVERAERLKQVGREYAGAAGQEPISFMVWDGEAVIAHAMTFCRVVQTDGRDLPVMALSLVAADPDRRGEGLGQAIADAAFGRVDAGDFPFALFQTSQAVRPFYERLGCRVVENDLVNSLNEDDPNANPFWDEWVMRYPAGGDWPSGPIDLCGKGY